MQRNLIKLEPDILEETGVSVIEQNIPAGTTYALHWHEYLEFEIIISGEARHIYNNHTYHLAPGDAFLMCYCDFHELTALTDLRLYSVHFTSSILSSDLAKLLDYNRFHCHLTTQETERVLQLIRTLIQEDLERRSYYQLLLHQYVNEIVILMVRKSTVSTNDLAPLPIQKAVSYLNEHFTEKITLEKLAQELALSTNYLGQLFKQQLGCTFHEYLNRLRLKYACRLLRATDLSVKEIGFTAGYQSTEHFLYVFRSNLQLTPTQYRRQ